MFGGGALEVKMATSKPGLRLKKITRNAAFFLFYADAHLVLFGTKPAEHQYK